MSRFVKHVVARPETLQAIATQELQDTSRWMEIATLNSLKYPYIADTNEEKELDPLHLVTFGDVINLPDLNEASDLEITTLDNNGKERAYDMALGMDISLDFDWKMGMDDDLMFMHPDSSRHDIATVAGIANLKESIQKRLNTKYGSLMYHPNYGTHLISMVGEKLTPNLVENIKVEVIRTIKTDTRVRDAEITFFEVPDGRSFFCLVSIQPVSADDAFAMFVEKAQNGTLRIG